MNMRSKTAAYPKWSVSQLGSVRFPRHPGGQWRSPASRQNARRSRRRRALSTQRGARVPDASGRRRVRARLHPRALVTVPSSDRSCQRSSKTDLDHQPVRRVRHRCFRVPLRRRMMTAVGAVGNRGLCGFPSSLWARSSRPWGAAASTAPPLAGGGAFG